MCIVTGGVLSAMCHVFEEWAGTSSSGTRHHWLEISCPSCVTCIGIPVSFRLVPLIRTESQTPAAAFRATPAERRPCPARACCPTAKAPTATPTSTTKTVATSDRPNHTLPILMRHPRWADRVRDPICPHPFLSCVVTLSQVYKELKIARTCAVPRRAGRRADAGDQDRRHLSARPDKTPVKRFEHSDSRRRGFRASGCCSRSLFGSRGRPRSDREPEPV